MACRIIVSAPVPFPFLWTLGFGFGTWIWDLDLGPGFGTDLGLTIYFSQENKLILSAGDMLHLYYLQARGLKLITFITSVIKTSVILLAWATTAEESVPAFQGCKVNSR